MGSWNELLERSKLLCLDGVDHNRASLIYLCEQHAQDPDEDDRHFFNALGQLLSNEDGITVNTSGSTGAPKPIQISKDKLLASALVTIEALNIPNGAVLAHCLSCHHIGGIIMLVRALALGAELIRLPITSDPLAELDESERIDFIAMVPLQVLKSIEDGTNRTKFARIKNVLIGGAPLDAHTSDQLKAFSNTIFSTFGMTETLSHIALKKIAPEPEDHFECIGPTTVSIDEEKRLIIHAPHLSEQKIQSNDMVELLDNKRFRWLGRYDNVINSGGIKLNPEMLEEKIASRVDGRFFLGAKDDPELGQALVLYVEGEKRKIDLSGLLDKYEKPREIVFVERFEETGNGKVDRNAVVIHSLFQ